METETTYIPAKEVGPLIKATLRRQFPGVAFSVRMSRGTGYGTFYINWTDGPTVHAVDKAIAHYEGASFDGMTDSTVYHGPTLESTPDGFRSVRYGTKFLLTSRSRSAAFEAWASAQEAAYWADYEKLPEYERQCRLHQRISRTTVTANGYETEQD